MSDLVTVETGDTNCNANFQLEPSVNQNGIGPQESVYDFMQLLFAEVGFNVPLEQPKKDDLTKKVRVEVPNLTSFLDANAFVDRITALEDYFPWYDLDDTQRMAFVKV